MPTFSCVNSNNKRHYKHHWSAQTLFILLTLADTAELIISNLSIKTGPTESILSFSSLIQWDWWEVCTLEMYIYIERTFILSIQLSTLELGGVPLVKSIVHPNQLKNNRSVTQLKRVMAMSSLQTGILLLYIAYLSQLVSGKQFQSK